MIKAASTFRFKKQGCSNINLHQLRTEKYRPESVRWAILYMKIITAHNRQCGSQTTAPESQSTLWKPTDKLPATDSSCSPLIRRKQWSNSRHKWPKFSLTPHLGQESSKPFLSKSHQSSTNCRPSKLNQKQRDCVWMDNKSKCIKKEKEGTIKSLRLQNHYRNSRNCRINFWLTHLDLTNNL